MFSSLLKKGGGGLIDRDQVTQFEYDVNKRINLLNELFTFIRKLLPSIQLNIRLSEFRKFSYSKT